MAGIIHRGADVHHRDLRFPHRFPTDVGDPQRSAAGPEGPAAASWSRYLSSQAGMLVLSFEVIRTGDLAADVVTKTVLSSTPVELALRTWMM